MASRISMHLATCTALVGALGAMATPAFAQQAATTQTPQADSGLGEIIVTAERRSSSTQKTAQAITAVSSDALVHSGVVNASGLSNVVPGVQVNQGGGFSQIVIRGVGGGVVNNFGEPGVAYNIAGVYIAQPYGGNAAFYDIQRVEVLKGPQGTLYGRNSTAGAINIVPNRPEIGSLAGGITAQAGNYSDLEVQGFLNVPLGDQFAARVSGSAIKHDGYFSNGQSDANDRSLRGQLLYKPSSTFSINFIADYFKETGKGPGDTPIFPGTDFNGAGAIQPGGTGRYLNPSDPWQNLDGSWVHATGFAAPNATVAPYADPHINHEQLILSAELNADLGFANLTIIPGYVTTKVNDHLANYGYNSDVFTDAKQFTAEARLASTGSGPLKWVLGLYHFNQKNNSTQTFFQFGLGYITLGTPKLDSDSYAAFGQATYTLTTGLRLTGGVRYTTESKDINGATVAPGVPAFLCPNFIPATGTGYGVSDRCSVANTGHLKFNSFNWKAGVEYDVGPRSLIYANASTGFRSGGFNPGSPPNTFDPEKLYAYEVGSKNEFMGGKLRVNVSAFYWDYKRESNPVFGPINPIGLAFVVVPGSSHVYGAELESAVKLSPHDTFAVNGLIQQSNYVRYSTLAIPFIGVPAAVYDGMRRPLSPTLSGNASYEHTFELASGAEVAANANISFASTSILSLAQPSPVGFSQSGYALGNLSLTYSAPAKAWSVTAYVNNVTNHFVATSVLQSTTTGNVFQQALPPRTYGVRASVKF